MANLIQRLRYFNGQFLREPDFTAEQDYHLHHQRDHMRLLHNPGIAQGLDIPNPPAGATAVTVHAGIAFDDQGRRILLPDDRLVDLVALPDNQVAFVTIAYRETETDPTDENGTVGDTNTRWTEDPLVAPVATAPANPKETLVLARIERTGKVISKVDSSARLVAGAKAGDVEVFSLTFKSDAIAPAGWVQTRLDSPRVAKVGGSLTVAGDLAVTGTISGDIAVGSVKPGDLANDAVVSANLAKADGSSGQDTNNGTGVKTGHIQNGAVTNTKIGSDVSARIATGETHAAATGNPHGTTATDIDGTTNQIVARINAGNGVLIAARIDTAIARVTQVTASAIDGGTNQIVAQINAGTGTVIAARIDTAIARVTQVTAGAIDGGTNQIVTQINGGTGVINTARLAVTEKLNGKFVNGQVTLPQANPLLLTNRDLRGKLITIRGWISSAADATPSILATATQVKTWSPPTPAVQEAWVFCKTSAPLPTQTALFSITDPPTGNPIAFALQFANGALNLVMTGAAITFGYVFQITWQE